MTPLLTLENIRSGAVPSDAVAVGFLLGQIERLTAALEEVRSYGDCDDSAKKMYWAATNALRNNAPQVEPGACAVVFGPGASAWNLCVTCNQPVANHKSAPAEKSEPASREAPSDRVVNGQRYWECECKAPDNFRHESTEWCADCGKNRPTVKSGAGE